MTRRTFTSVVFLAGCSSRQELPLMPSKPMAFTNAGLHWTILDDRKDLIEFQEPGVVRPVSAVLTASGYRHTIVEPNANSAPGHFGSVFNDASLAKGNTQGSNGYGAIFHLALVGLLELVNIGLFATKTVSATAGAMMETGEDPGVTCDLTAMLELTWPGGRRKTVPLKARGWSVKDSSEKTYREAAQRAQDALGHDVVKQCWQAVRSGP
jgi:hypothetical protein